MTARRIAVCCDICGKELRRSRKVLGYDVCPSCLSRIRDKILEEIGADKTVKVTGVSEKCSVALLPETEIIVTDLWNGGETRSMTVEDCLNEYGHRVSLARIRCCLEKDQTWKGLDFDILEGA